MLNTFYAFHRVTGGRGRGGNSKKFANFGAKSVDGVKRNQGQAKASGCRLRFLDVLFLLTLPGGQMLRPK